jgi:hypothetical protein
LDCGRGGVKLGKGDETGGCADAASMKKSVVNGRMAMGTLRNALRDMEAFL